MNTLYSNDKSITVKKNDSSNINCSVPFVKHDDSREQELNIDSTELYYNPSTRTLHADNFNGGIPSLLEGESIRLSTGNNSTTIDVDFDKNTLSTTSVAANDKILLQDGLSFMKTISGANLRTTLKPIGGTNLSYGTGSSVNTLSLDSTITATTLGSNCIWNGSLIDASKIANGSVSDVKFQKLAALTSDILQQSNSGAASGVCPLSSTSIIPTQYLPSSINDIIEVANFASLPATGESNKIYVTLDNHKAYRWSGTAYVEISASLVIGTSAGTAYDGASGQTNADNIALKQDQLSNGSNISIDASNHVNLNDNISTNLIETKTNLILRTQTTNNADYLNNILFQNTGSFFNIALTRRYNSNDVSSNRSNFCIQTGGSSSINGLPVRLVVQNNGNVNIGSSQTKTHSFNVEGTSNFEGYINLTAGSSYKIDNIDVLSDASISSVKNFVLNARIIQNLNSSKDGLFINYMSTQSATNAHCRFYSGGNATERMFIEATGDIGINTVNPTEKLHVNGNINLSTGYEYKINGTAIVHSYIDGNNISIDASTKSINLNSPLLGISDIKNSGDTVFTRNNIQIAKIGTNGFELLNSKKLYGDVVGPIKPYIIQDTNNFDQPIVSYKALGGSVVNLPPSQLQLIVPDSSKIITINHSTGLLKTKDIFIDGTITNASSITATQFVGTLSGNATTVTNGVYLDETSTQTINGNISVKQLDIDGTQCIHQPSTGVTNVTATNLTATATMYTSALNASTINTSTLNAAANIDCERMTGGTNNSASNFHIDCINAAGEMFLNYYNNNNLRMGNVPATSLTAGGRFTIFSNQTVPLRLHNNCASAFTTGWTNSIQQDSAFNGAKMIQGFYRSNSITTYTHSILCSNQNGHDETPLWLNCYHGDSVNWSPGYKFAPVGGDTITRRMFCGVRPQMSLTQGLSNASKVNVGRSSSYDYGIRLGGFNGATEKAHHLIQGSSNFHIDASFDGDMYLNYYGQSTNARNCRIFRCICTSDRRIKTNFIPIVQDDLLSQIENLELTTYNFKDPKFTSDKNTLGFIADSLENKSYFDGFVVVDKYSMPFDEIDQIELEYVLKDKIITVSNYTLDLTKEYYYYAYKEDGTFLTIENKPLTTNSFDYFFDANFVRLVVIGEKRDDCKSIKPEKLIPGAYAGIQALIQKNKSLEEKNTQIVNKMYELEMKIDMLMKHVKL